MVRQKNRYILCEILNSHNKFKKVQVTDKETYHAIRTALQTAHGDYGVALLLGSLNIKYLNPDTGILTIRASRAGYKMVTTTLPFIREIGSQEVVLKILHIGGTIRTCQKFVVRHHRRQLVQLLRTTTDPEERAKIQAMLLKSDRKPEGTQEQEDDEDDIMDIDL